MTEAYEKFLQATQGLEPFTAEWFQVLAGYSSRALEYDDLSMDLQELINSGGGGMGYAVDFGTFSNPADFSVNFGTF